MKKPRTGTHWRLSTSTPGCLDERGTSMPHGEWPGDLTVPLLFLCADTGGEIRIVHAFHSVFSTAFHWFKKGGPGCWELVSLLDSWWQGSVKFRRLGADICLCWGSTTWHISGIRHYSLLGLSFPTMPLFLSSRSPFYPTRPAWPLTTSTTDAVRTILCYFDDLREFLANLPWGKLKERGTAWSTTASAFWSWWYLRCEFGLVIVLRNGWECNMTYNYN